MKLTLHRADEFNADFDQQYRWYLEQAGEAVAERFLDAAAATLCLLAEQSDLGRRRKFRHPRLRDLRSFQVKHPFQKIFDFLSRDGKCFAGLAAHARRSRFVSPAA